jgi:hypothetical protein
VIQAGQLLAPDTLCVGVGQSTQGALERLLGINRPLKPQVPADPGVRAALASELQDLFVDCFRLLRHDGITSRARGAQPLSGGDGSDRVIHRTSLMSTTGRTNHAHET